MTALDMWWYRPPAGHTNLGDELGPAILTRLGYEVRRVPPDRAELVACGSILEMLDRQGRDGTMVWGSGLIGRGGCTRRLDYRAVRGRLTAAKLGHNDAIPLGDPGLLVSELWPRPPVRYQVGVVPHYVDGRTFPWADVVIDVRRPVDEVVAQIGACATIASSSLHGLVVAQSYGIPAVRLHHDRVIGQDFKWADYLTGVAPDLATVQKRLLGALP